jgi:phospholipase C
VSGRPGLRLLVLATAALAAALVCAAAAGAHGRGEPAPRTPIRHFIALMQENHSFDNYFGAYPGADGIPIETCQRVDLRDSGAGCIQPFRIGGRSIQDLDHNVAVARGQYRRGRMDGFVDAMRRETGRLVRVVMGHYDDRDLPFYWNVADNFVLFDRFFTSALAGSVSNHMFWVAGTPGIEQGREAVPAEGFGDLPTIFDRLERAGISWKFYVQNYNPNITFRTPQVGDRGSQLVWVPPLDFARFVDNPKLFRHIVDLDEYYKDLARGTLPSVAYIAPSGSSEHPPGSVKAGQAFVRTLISSLMRSGEWTSSAFMWSYDDWGGWYDHVRPPRVDRHGYGFRAPALLVSSYARRGHVDSRTLDFTSQLKFIEGNWGLKPLASRDARANDLLPAFDFSRPPRPARFLSLARHVRPPPQPRRLAVYIAYPAALLATAGMVAAAAWRSRRRAAAPGALAGSTNGAGSA